MKRRRAGCSTATRTRGVPAHTGHGSAIATDPASGCGKHGAIVAGTVGPAIRGDYR